MGFKTKELKTGIIKQQLLVIHVEFSICYALLTTGKIIKFDCKNQNDAEQIEIALRGSFFRIDSFKLMEFEFKISVLDKEPPHSY